MTTIKVIFNKINVDIQKAASKKGRKKKLTINCCYLLLSGFLVTFTNIGKVSFAMPCRWGPKPQSFIPMQT